MFLLNWVPVVSINIQLRTRTLIRNLTLQDSRAEEESAQLLQQPPESEGGAPRRAQHLNVPKEAADQGGDSIEKILA